MAAQELPPIVFEPILKEKIWGGDTLSHKLKKKLPAHTRIGESWELSGYGDDLSTALTAPVSGMVLSDIIRVYGDAIFGGVSEDDGYFPLLFKYIDAWDKLSVQVHPDDHHAQSHGLGKFGKSECWYVVDAKPDAQIIAGFRPGVEVEDIRRAIETKQLETLLNYTPIAPGDVIFIPAGTVHAILGGTLIYEVQETSDTTFRLYDWDRVDDQGKKRPLHIEESIQVLDTSCHEHCKIKPVICEDIDGGHHAFRAVCKYFALEEYRLRHEMRVRLPHKKSFQVITVLDGAAAVVTEAGTQQLETGITALIPARCDNVIVETSTNAHLLVSTIPDIRAEVIEPLRDLGFSDVRIAELGGYQSRNDIVDHL